MIYKVKLWLNSYKKFIWQKVILSSDIHFLDAYQPNIEGKIQIVTDVFPNDESNLCHKAKLYQVWRPYKNGYIVTLTLANQQVVASTGKDYSRLAEATLFDNILRCTVLDGNVESYPQKDFSLLSDEERELELRYKNVKNYAIGHAVAVDWSIKNGNRVLETNFMPRVEVPSVTANTAGSETRHLNFKFLLSCYQNDNVITELHNFADGYGEWISAQAGLKNTMESHEKTVAQNIIDRTHNAHSRIKEGIEFLKSNKQARLAFSFMNDAMLKQMTANQESPNLENYNWRRFSIGVCVDDNEVFG